MQALQGDAVPQLHHESTADGETVHVAEAVSHHEHARTQRETEAAPSGSRLGIESQLPRGLELGRRTREPHQSHGRRQRRPRLPVERQRPLADADPGAEHPESRRARNHERREGSERVEGEAQHLAGVACSECEARHDLRRFWHDGRMSVLSDLRAARKVIGNAVATRTTRRTLASRLKDQRPPAPGSVTIAVYFADTAVNLYQVRQWYAPLAELAASYGVAIITRSPSSSLVMLDESPVPIVYCRAVTDIEEFVESQDIRIVFYVNQNAKNFQMFRYSRMWHVFINHGESDKMYMTTNQFKAYDYAFVAGQAARERLGRKLWDFDLDKRAIPIGRPQADHLAGELPYPADDRTVVLYAPTWEGDRPTAAYGSIASHGVALANAVLASSTHRLVYRPHPRSGVLDPAYRAANEQIIAAIAAANARDSSAHHVFDDGPEIGWQLRADVAITDISAMVYDRLATGRPILVTLPVSPEAELDMGGYLGSAAWLTADEAPNVLELVDRVQNDAPALENLKFWADHHFGDTSPGAATARFHAAIEQLLAEWERNAQLHADDADEDDGGEPLDDADDEGMPSV